jgi:hypothetical protein
LATKRASCPSDKIAGFNVFNHAQFFGAASANGNTAEAGLDRL